MYFKPFFPAGKPSPPIINNSETETLGCHVNVTWSKPDDNGCPLTKYSVYFIQIQLRETEEPWYEIQTTDILKTYRVLRLSCDTQYMIEMSAWNELGQSNRSRRWIVTTNRRTPSGKFHGGPYICIPESVIPVRGHPGSSYQMGILERGRKSAMLRARFFNSQFWNENGQNVKCTCFSIPHSYSGMDRMPLHPFCSQGQNEQNAANENPRWRTAR